MATPGKKGRGVLEHSKRLPVRRRGEVATPKCFQIYKKFKKYAFNSVPSSRASQKRFGTQEDNVDKFVFHEGYRKG